MLDGTTDPLVGGDDGVVGGRLSRTTRPTARPPPTDRFVELCDLQRRLPRRLGGDTAALLDELAGRPSTNCRPTTSPANRRSSTRSPSTACSRAHSAYAYDWPLFATALRDARDGDASALAALAAEDPLLSEDDSSERAGPSFLVANLVIYCADFAERIEGSTFCDPLPRNEFTITPIEAVDVDRLDPGHRHGVRSGHPRATTPPSSPTRSATRCTSSGKASATRRSPASSRCIDQIVSDQLLDGPLPDDGQRCSFVDGVSDEVELADDLFAHDRSVAANWIAGVQEDERRRRRHGDVHRRGGRRAPADDRTISHVVLGVESEPTRSRRSTRAAAAAC